MDACRRNDTNYFVRHASEINQPLKDSIPGKFTYALIIAAREGKTNIVEELLQLGANPKIKDWRTGNALITLAGEAEGDPRPTMSRLLGAGLEVNADDSTGATALHHAAMTGETVVVDFLLRSGARLDVKDRLGNTPLHTVGTPEKAKLLLSAGASLSLKNDAGYTPIDLAQHNHSDVYKYYLSLSK